MPATKPDPMIDHYAKRLLSTQDVQRGSLRGDGPPTPLQVAAVMHGLADHTAILHMLNVIVAEKAMARPADADYEPAATSLGRYFHALGDSMEWDESEKRRAANDSNHQNVGMYDLLVEARALLSSDSRIGPDRRQQFRDLLDSLTTTPTTGALTSHVSDSPQ